MFSTLKLGIAAALAATLLAGALWLYLAGGNAVIAEQAKQALEAWQEREDIDNANDSLDAADLCLRLGGVQSDCDHLRGVEKTAQGE
tara:strand:- start:684 stop:944 length:261 start_codon:yes stop_codon:yes gene_type:complete